MSKKIKIRIFPDGLIKAEVQGIKGRKCTNYIKTIEELLNADIMDSEYTKEYYEKESIEIGEYEIEKIQINQ